MPQRKPVPPWLILLLQVLGLVALGFVAARLGPRSLFDPAPHSNCRGDQGIPARCRSARVAKAIGVRLGIADGAGNPARDGLGTDVSWKICICTDTPLSW